MKRVLWTALMAVVCLLAPATLAFSQQTPINGSIAGTITDPSGAAVANATVELRSAPMHHKLTQKTGGDGRFRFPALAAGEYRVTISAPGFAEETRTVSVHSSEEASVSPTLRVAVARAMVDV